MERALYCSLSELQRLHDFHNSNQNKSSSEDWRIRILGELDFVYAFTSDSNYLVKLSEIDEQSFISFSDGTSSHSEKEKALIKLMALNEWLGDKLFPVNKLDGLYPERLINGAICKSAVENTLNMSRSGVESIDDIEDKWASNLRNFWSENTINGEPFSWSEFFGDNIPTSSAAIMVDRYLFTDALKGAQNVASILRAIIPKEYERKYVVTFVFQYFDNVSWKKERLSLEEALAHVDKHLVHLIKEMNVKCSFNYIAIVDPDSVKEFGTDKKAWKKLQYFSHDRRVLTSYYQVLATFGLSAANNTTAIASQRIMFESLLSNVDNPRQKRDGIPFYTIRNQLNDLSSCLASVPNRAIHCYGFDFKERRFSEGNVRMIKNPLLDIPKKAPWG